jgi:hypothetical protein
VPTNPAGLIYGTITVAALLAAETARRETYARTVAAVALTLIVYWVAHSYAEFAGERITEGEHVSVAGLLRAARRGLAVLMGAAIPFLVLLGCWAFGASLGAAVSAGIWAAVAIVVLAEVVIGIRTELRGRDLAVQTGVGVLLGLLVVLLRVVLH